MKLEFRICDTCHEEITDDLSRFFILNDVDCNPHVKFFHWFSPCWNIENFFQKYSNLKIIKIGYDVDENTYKNPQFVKQLKSDLKLWS